MCKTCAPFVHTARTHRERFTKPLTFSQHGDVSRGDAVLPNPEDLARDLLAKIKHLVETSPLAKRFVEASRRASEERKARGEIDVEPLELTEEVMKFQDVPQKFHHRGPAELADATVLSHHFTELSKTVQLSSSREEFINDNIGFDVESAPQAAEPSLQEYYDRARAAGDFRDTSFELFQELHSDA